jgi:hypothetical protein
MGRQSASTQPLIESFGRAMRENLTTGTTPFRKAYLRSLIDIVEVDDAHTRIKGGKDVLEKAVLASRPGAEPRSQMSTNRRAIQNRTTSSYVIELRYNFWIAILLERTSRPTSPNSANMGAIGLRSLDVSERRAAGRRLPWRERSRPYEGRPINPIGRASTPRFGRAAVLSFTAERWH